MDATKRPLQVPPAFATYAEKHGIFDMYKVLLQEVIINKPDDPLTFISELLKKENDNVPCIMVLGPPASGKRTIAKMICSKLRSAHLTTDTIIEEADTADKTEALRLKELGQPIPTELWTKMTKSRLAMFDCIKKGYVMEAFPSTREQALALQAAGVHPTHTVLLDCADTVLIERAAGKRVDPRTGDVYHTTFDMPTNSDVVSRLQTPPGCSEAEVVDLLVEHHRNIHGLLACYPDHNIINADQPKADVFSQAMSYVACNHRTAAPHTPRIMLLGPTGSGKGVQAALIANKYNIVNVSMGQLLKQAVAEESKIGQACKLYIEKSMVVPDAFVLKVLQERLSQLDCVSRGWVLHGYPLTREQGEQLSGAGHIPNRVFFLDVPNDSVIERLTLRAVDPVTGARYHMLYSPPRTHQVKERLQIRPCDSEDAVRKRLANYNAYVEELEDFFLTDAQHVNADQDPHTVFETIESMIVNPLPKTFPN